MSWIRSSRGSQSAEYAVLVGGIACFGMLVLAELGTGAMEDRVRCATSDMGVLGSGASSSCTAPHDEGTGDWRRSPMGSADNRSARVTSTPSLEPVFVHPKWQSAIRKELAATEQADSWGLPRPSGEGVDVAVLPIALGAVLAPEVLISGGLGLGALGLTAHHLGLGDAAVDAVGWALGAPESDLGFEEEHGVDTETGFIERFVTWAADPMQQEPGFEPDQDPPSPEGFELPDDTNHAEGMTTAEDWGAWLLARTGVEGGDDERDGREGADAATRFWLDSEQQANRESFRKFGVWPADVVHVPIDEVVIEVLEGTDPAIIERFVQGDYVLMPRHPWNTNAAVPFQDLPVAETWAIEPTASRSAVPTWSLEPETPRVSVKMPTDHPHGPGTVEQPKWDLRLTLEMTMARERHIAAVDARIGPSDQMVILHDVLSIRDPITGNGIAVRDLSPMRSGFFYVPALSIPYIGAAIAEANGQPFEQFWEDLDARGFAEVKAEFTARYGLVFENPNAQNRLHEFDPNFRPTRRIFLRDVGDTRFHDQIAPALGFGDLAQADAARGREWEPLISYDPEAGDSYWQMEYGMPEGIVRGWRTVHEEAYAAALSGIFGNEVRPGAWRFVFPEARQRLRDRFDGLERAHQAHP